MKMKEVDAQAADLCSAPNLICSVKETNPGKWQLDLYLLDDYPAIIDVNAACNLITSDPTQHETCTNSLEDLGRSGGAASLNFDNYGRVYFSDPLFAAPVTYDTFAVAGALDMSTSSVKSPSSNELVPNRHIELDSLTIGILGAIVVVISSIRALWVWEMRRLSLPEKSQSADTSSPVQTPSTQGRIQNIIKFLNHNRGQAIHLPESDPGTKPLIDSRSHHNLTRPRKHVANRFRPRPKS